jgi:hypothetical protein
MAVDLTQFIEGDPVIATLRGSIRPTIDGELGLQIEPDNGGHVIPLECLIRAEHVTPEIKARQYYIDGTGNLFVGHADGTIFGPLASQHARRHEPTELVLIRGLRPAEVRPVVPA